MKEYFTEQYLESMRSFNRGLIDGHGIPVDPLSPNEVVALHRSLAADETLANVQLGDRPSGLQDRLAYTLNLLPQADTPQAIAVLTAFADSALPTDRTAALSYLPSLLEVDHDSGVALWDRLITDEDKTVRDAAEQQLVDVLDECRTRKRGRPPRFGRGDMYAVDRVDDARLQEAADITRDDAYHLVESYAYAENGQYLFDLGQTALNKLVIPEPRRPVNRKSAR